MNVDERVSPVDGMTFKALFSADWPFGQERCRIVGIGSLLGSSQSLRLASHKFDHSSITNRSFAVIENIQPWNKRHDLIPAERIARPVRR